MHVPEGFIFGIENTLYFTFYMENSLSDTPSSFFRSFERAQEEIKLLDKKDRDLSEIWFSMRKCWSANMAVWTYCTIVPQLTGFSCNIKQILSRHPHSCQIFLLCTCTYVYSHVHVCILCMHTRCFHNYNHYVFMKWYFLWNKYFPVLEANVVTILKVE